MLALKRILQPERKEVTGECPRLPKEHLSFVFISPMIIQVIK